MKHLSKTTKSLFAAAGILGVASVAFAASGTMQSNDAVTATQAKVSLDQAMQIAKQKAQGDIISAEFDDEKGGKYEVEITDGQNSHEVKINANTGEVIKVKQETLDKEDLAEYSAYRQAKVPLTQAMQTASQTVGGQVVGGEFSLEKGKALYEIEVVKANQVYDVEVDANTGSILSSQLDTENENDDEKDEKNETARQIQPLIQAVNAVQSA